MKASTSLQNIQSETQEQLFLFIDDESLARDAIDRCASRLAEKQELADKLLDYRRIAQGDTLWLVTRRGKSVETVAECEGKEIARRSMECPSVAEACLAFEHALAVIEGEEVRPNVAGRNHKVSLNGVAVVRTEKEATLLFNEVRPAIEAMVAKNRRALASDYVDHDEIRSISEIAAFNACLRWREEGEGNASLASYVSSAIQLRIAEAVTAAQEVREKVTFVSVDEPGADGESLGYERFADERAWSAGRKFFSRAFVGLRCGWPIKPKKPTPLFAKIISLLRRVFGGEASIAA